MYKVSYISFSLFFSLKNMEQKISSFFLESSVARVSEEIGFGTVLNKVSNFWNENFSWESGKFSPKNILKKEKHKVEGREERLLDAPLEKLDIVEPTFKVIPCTLYRY